MLSLSVLMSSLYQTTDAMILSDLFQKLFVRGVTLIATSNIAPDGLYKTVFTVIVSCQPLKWLKELCCLNVDAGVDYRLRVLKQAQLFKSH